MKTRQNGLTQALWPAGRRAVLGLLLLNQGQEWHLRELARRTGLSPAALHAELHSLVSAGILHRRVEARRTYYRAETACPIFPELRQIALKTMGLGDAVRAALAELKDRIAIAFLYGSYASAQETAASDIDILLIGKLSAREAAAALGKVSHQLGRELNPVIYPPEEFRKKARQGHHFITQVLQIPKIFLIGDEHELAELVGRK